MTETPLLFLQACVLFFGVNLALSPSPWSSLACVASLAAYVFCELHKPPKESSQEHRIKDLEDRVNGLMISRMR